MGAIGGVFGVGPETPVEARLQRMADAMRFRGPEAEARHVDADVGLLACYWKTLPGTDQPVVNEDGTIVAVCDGEIYNGAELAAELIARGHRLDPANDLAALPHLYEEHGADFCRRVNGSFVVALWDRSQRRLLLVRDHMGTKCLFYTRAGGGIRFASTVRGVLANPEVEACIDPSGVNAYFGNTCVPNPRTLFRGIRNLRPGHALVVTKDAATEERYWDLQSISEDDSLSFEECAAQIRESILDAIRVRTLGERSMGSVLSGGVDSSAISAVLGRLRPDPVETFSIRFVEADYDDSALQEQMFRDGSLVRNAYPLQPDEAIHLLEQVIVHSDYPLNNSSALGTFRCFQMAKEKVDVLFEGEGADELFCGGGAIHGERLVQRFTAIPLPLRRLLFGLVGRSLHLDSPGRIGSWRRFAHRLTLDDTTRILSWLPCYDAEARRRLLLPAFRAQVDNDDVLAEGKRIMQPAQLKDWANRYQYGASLTYMCNDLLFKNERMAAANGLVNRTPFVDYRLTELAFRVPGRYKLWITPAGEAKEKYVYRKALEGIIPDDVLWRRKTRGFTQPTSVWMRGELKAFVADTLLGETARRRGIWDPAFVERIAKHHFAGRKNYDQLLWGLLTFELWMREHADRRMPTELPATPRRRIPILHVIDSLETGGMENVLVTLVKGLGTERYAHSVCCVSRLGVNRDRLPPEVAVFTLNKQAGHSWRVISAMRRWMRRERPAIVQTYAWAGYDGVVAARLARIPCVIHAEHGWGADDPHGRDRKRNLIRRIGARAVRRFVVVSADLERWLVETIGVAASKVVQILNGVDTERFRPPAATTVHDTAHDTAPDRPTVIGIVGRLDPIKNHELLFRAFSRLDPGARGVTLQVVGDGSERARLEALRSELPGGERIELLGERYDVEQWYPRFDLFVLPSWNEGISCTIQEAMASGLPVIASRVGGNPELISDGETGLLVPAGDEDALHAALAALLDSPQRRRTIGENARREALRRFGIDAMVARYDELYSSLFAAVPPRRYIAR